jgi:hypothetical protein
MSAYLSDPSFFLRVAETGYRDIQLRKYGREKSPSQYTSRYRKHSIYNCEKDIKVRGASIDSSDPSTKQFTVLSHLPSSSHGRRYSSNNFEHSAPGVDSFEEESEVLELVLRFLGPWGKTFYQTILMMLMFVGLIAYTQVFVNTFQLQIAPNISTMIPSLLFGLIAIPLSCVDLAEQISVQVVMSILRFLSLATLLFGTIAAMVIDPHPSSTPSLSGEGEIEDPISYYQFSGFGLMFTTAIFSQLFQHSVPGLIRPLQHSEKQHVSSIFSWALMTTGTIYILTGTICTIYFRGDINPAINLNFVNYYWGVTPPSLADGVGILSHQYLFFLVIKSLSMLIVLFPALDTLSVFPLIANTLGNNFHAAFPKGYKHTTKYLRYLPHSVVQFLLRSSSPTGTRGASSSSTPIIYSTSNSYQIRQLTLRCWRLVAAFPPVIISLFITNLSLTLQVAGTCGVLVALVIPALLQYYSLLEVPDLPSLSSDKKYNPNSVHFEPNPYGGHFSQFVYIYLVLVIALIALGVCVLQIVSSLV